MCRSGGVEVLVCKAVRNSTGELCKAERHKCQAVLSLPSFGDELDLF